MKAKSLVDVEKWEVMDAISELFMAFGILVCRAAEVFCICYSNTWIAWTSRHTNVLHWHSAMTQRLWLTQAALSQRSSLDWRQIQFSHNETVNRNSHEKGAPYATKISSTKCFSFTLILLSVWALEKQSVKQKTQTSKHTKKPPKLSSCGFLQNTFDGTFT